jgi:hypothetical protein
MTQAQHYHLTPSHHHAEGIFLPHGPLEPSADPEARGVMVSWLWVVIMLLVALLASYFRAVV